MSHSEAGKLGGDKFAIIAKKEKDERVKEYNKNPILCKCCQKPLTYEQKIRKLVFCSQSCNASFNNKRRPKLKKNNCLNCNEECNHNRSKYCSIKCQKEFEYNDYINNWLDGRETGNVKSGCSTTIKKYLKETRGEKCELCGWNKVNKKTGNVPIEIDHIDGNYTNNRPENLRIVCPNCHSLQETHKALNKGKGRKYRG